MAIKKGTKLGPLTQVVGRDLTSEQREEVLAMFPVEERTYPSRKYIIQADDWIDAHRFSIGKDGRITWRKSPLPRAEVTSGLRRHLDESKAGEVHEVLEASYTPTPLPVPVEPIKADEGLGSELLGAITHLSKLMAEQTAEAERMRRIRSVGIALEAHRYHCESSNQKLPRSAFEAILGELDLDPTLRGTLLQLPKPRREEKPRLRRGQPQEKNGNVWRRENLVDDNFGNR